MQTKTHITFFFIFLFFGFSIPSKAQLFKITTLNFESRHQVYEDIEQRLGYTNGMESIEMRLIMHKIEELVTDAVFDPDFQLDEFCAEIDYTDPALVTLGWDQGAAFNEYYYGYYLNVQSIVFNGSSGTSQIEETDISSNYSDNATLKFPLESLGGPHLFLVNKRNSVNQKNSSYTIIIAERIALLTSQGGIGCNRNRNESNSSFQSSNIALNISPNLLINTDPIIELELPQTENASISVVNGANGNLMYNLIQNKEFPLGNHRLRLPTADLPPGIYYLVLQTKERRIVKKMVKVRN